MSRITATAIGQSLTGTSGADIFSDGGFGFDTMTGGTGHDTYYVNDINDSIVENPGEGTDSVISSIDYTLPANVENLKLTGAAHIGTGNDWNNTIIGTSGGDTLDGGDGADLMIGGAGNDLFYINIFNQSGINKIVGSDDVIVDNGGHDTVATHADAGSSDFSYIMQTGLYDADFSLSSDNYTVTGNAAGNGIFAGNGNNNLSGMDGNDSITAGNGNDTMSGGTGNDSLIAVNGNDSLSGGTGNDVLTALSGNDTLDGGSVADTMTAGAGSDTFYVDNVHDFVSTPGSAHDLIMSSISINLLNVQASYANVENVTLTGIAALNLTGDSDGVTITGNSLTGNAGANIITGGAGNDTLDGGGYHDVLTGGAGADTFSFSSAKEFATITDFNVSQGDKIDLTHVLTGYSVGLSITGFVHILDSGSNSIIEINPGGDGIAKDFITIGEILGVNGLTGPQALLNDGILIA